MKDVKDVKKVDKIDANRELFFSALGQLNTNIVTHLINYPDDIAELTNRIKNFMCSEAGGDCSQYGPDYQWDEGLRACVRKPSASELPEGGGNN